MSLLCVCILYRKWERPKVSLRWQDLWYFRQCSPTRNVKELWRRHLSNFFVCEGGPCLPGGPHGTERTAAGWRNLRPLHYQGRKHFWMNLKRWRLTHLLNDYPLFLIKGLLIWLYFLFTSKCTRSSRKFSDIQIFSRNLLRKIPICFHFLPIRTLLPVIVFRNVAYFNYNF